MTDDRKQVVLMTFAQFWEGCAMPVPESIAKAIWDASREACAQHCNDIQKAFGGYEPEPDDCAESIRAGSWAAAFPPRA